MSEENGLTPEGQEIADAARASFDLGSRLRNRPMRTSTITLFTDEVLGNEHLEAERKIENVNNTSENLKRLALVAENLSLGEAKAALESLADAAVVDKKAVAALKKDAADIKKRLQQTSLTFSLQAVPPVILKDAKREVRKDMKITESGIPDAREEEFAEAFTERVLTKALVRYRDEETGAVVSGLSPADAKLLHEYLPPAEWARLDNALVDLNYKNAFGESVVDDADFSPSI